MALRTAVETGTLLSDTFFAGKKDNTPADDFLDSAFILADALRINSTTAPDKLPTVKKFKDWCSALACLLCADGPSSSSSDFAMQLLTAPLHRRLPGSAQIRGWASRVTLAAAATAA